MRILGFNPNILEYILFNVKTYFAIVDFGEMYFTLNRCPFWRRFVGSKNQLNIVEQITMFCERNVTPLRALNVSSLRFQRQSSCLK